MRAGDICWSSFWPTGLVMDAAESVVNGDDSSKEGSDPQVSITFALHC